MTETLLVLLVLIELARLVIQYWNFRKYAIGQEKVYAQAFEVKNNIKVVRRDQYTIRECLKQMAADGWELVAAYRTKNWSMALFFTKKKIKNFTEK